MLSKILLRFEDQEMARRYWREKREFYRKVTPIIATMLLVLAATLEIMYRALSYGEISISTSIINWGVFVSFVVLSIVVRKLIFTSFLICPLLTGLAFYYFAFLEFDNNEATIFYT